MITPRLTRLVKAASLPATRGRDRSWRGCLRLSTMAGVVALPAVLGSCVSVKAPDKPIVIELNINIRQEVVYRLAEDAGNTIKANPDIF